MEITETRTISCNAHLLFSQVSRHMLRHLFLRNEMYRERHSIESTYAKFVQCLYFILNPILREQMYKYSYIKITKDRRNMKK